MDKRGRVVTPLPAGTKNILITGNSNLIDYAKVSKWTPSNVYETDPADGSTYKSDGDGIVGFDPGWWTVSPDGVSRRSVLHYLLQQGVGTHYANANIINMAQGNTDCVDWYPGGYYWNRMVSSLAMLAGLGIVPHLHIHYVGCWEAFKGYSFEGVRGITNEFILHQQILLPGVRLKLGKRTYMAGVSQSAQDAVWGGMYQAICDKNNPLVSQGPDDDAMARGEPYDADGVHFGEVGRGLAGFYWGSNNHLACS